MTQDVRTGQNQKLRLAATPGGERLLHCVLCGSCTAGCPVSELDETYNPRRMMRLILAGEVEKVLQSGDIWKCYQCHACVAHCPQDARFADTVRALRQMATDEGFCPASLAATVEEIDLDTRKARLARIEALLAGEGAE